MKVNFFRAWLGSCSGTAIFFQLRSQNLWRALFHLLIISLLSALVISAGWYGNWLRTAMGTVEVINEYCGGIRCSVTGIEPLNDPEQPRSFVIAGPSAVTYLPDEIQQMPTDFQQGCQSGILWSGQRWGMWFDLNHGKFEFRARDVGGATVKSEQVNSADELLAAFKRSPELQVAFPENSELILSSDKLKQMVSVLLPAVLYLAVFMHIFLEVIVYIAMFVGVSALMNIGRPHRIGIRDMTVLAVYAGFPAMTAGSIADAMQLPLLDFNIIYVLGMTFYLIVIMNKLERDRQERNWRTRVE